MAALSDALRATAAERVPNGLYEYQAEALTYLLQGARIPPPLRGADNLTSFASNANDMLLYAPTGAGKTLVFATPIVHYLRSTIRGGDVFAPGRRPDAVAALVLLPTKELARQVFEVFVQALPEHAIVALTGDEPFSDEVAALQSRYGNGPDVVVSVANRLVLHAAPTAHAGNSCRWNCLRYLVLDEADRLLAKGYGDWVTALRHITFCQDELRGALAKTRVSRPNVLSTCWLDDDQSRMPACAPESSDAQACGKALPPSALLPDALVRPCCLQKIICTATDVKSFRGMRSLRLLRPLCLRTQWEKDRLRQSVKYTADSAATVECAVSTIVTILAKDKHQVLLFCQSVREVERMRRRFAELPAVATLSSTEVPAQRRRVLEDFRSEKIRLLIATSVAARGLNVLSLSHVVQLGMPSDADEYIHRVGRTARCGRRGRSILIVEKKHRKRCQQLLSEVRQLRPTSRIDEQDSDQASSNVDTTEVDQTQLVEATIRGE